MAGSFGAGGAIPLVPLLALGGAVVLGERLGPGAGLGALLVLAALFALAAPPARRRPQPARACSTA